MDDRFVGTRILVVEDEYFIASDLKRALKSAGAAVIGPVADVAGALALISNTGLDAAVLDVNLEGRQSFPIADVLAEREVPFIFVTGYDGWALPEKYHDTPRLAKPFSMSSVLAALEALLKTSQAL